MGSMRLLRGAVLAPDGEPREHLREAQGVPQRVLTSTLRILKTTGDHLMGNPEGT